MIWCEIKSGTKVYRQIHKIKQNNFSIECFRVTFLKFFTEKRQILAFREPTGYSAPNPSISGILLKYLKLFRNLLSVPGTKFFGDNNLVLFYLWWIEFMLKAEKVYKCFLQDCLKTFLLVFTSLKMHWNSKNEQFLVKKVKLLD